MEKTEKKQEAKAQQRKIFQCYKKDWELLPIFKGIVVYTVIFVLIYIFLITRLTLMGVPLLCLYL